MADTRRRKSSKPAVPAPGSPPSPPVPAAGGEALLSLREKCGKVLGTNLVPDIAEYLDTCFTGIELKGALPLQYVFGMNILPVGKFIMIVGPPSSYKSALLYWCMGLFMRAQGLGYYMETENKPNTDLLQAIINDRELLMNSFVPVYDKNNPATQEKIFQGIRQLGLDYPGLMKTVGYQVPILIGLDSIGSMQSEAMLNRICNPTAAQVRDGQDVNLVGYSAMHAASNIKGWLQGMITRYVSRYPILLMAVNHESAADAGFSSMDDGGGEEGGGKFGGPVQGGRFAPGQSGLKPTTGGRAKEFLASGRIGMQASMAKETQTSNIRTIYMRTDKNSIGVQHQSKLPIPFVTEFSRNGTSNRAYFDWDTALVDLLLSAKTPKVMQADLIGLAAGSNGRVSCKKLGLTGPIAEVGAALHADPECVRLIQDILGIARKPIVGQKPTTIGEEPADAESGGEAAQGDGAVESESSSE